MSNININTSNYNSFQSYLLLDFSFSFEKDVPHDDICRTVLEVAREVNINKYVDFSHRNTHGYDSFMMFVLVLLAKAEYGYASTRRLERLCKTDIRYMFIAKNQYPSHMAFQRFINDDLKMSIDDIFYEINRYIVKKMNINTDVLCIDGTKYEANANKNTFVWRANTIRNRTKRWKKTNQCIDRINRYFKKNNINLRYSLLKEPSIDYLLNISDRIEEYMKDEDIDFVHGRGKRRSDIQKLYDELKEHAMKMFEYTIHMDILGERNSFSKTDPDATFMHMKYDYYNHTNVFKPGYNIQIGVSDGIIRNIYISSDGNDINTYIPFMEKYYEAYGCYPKKTPADAGYGSYENYAYCKEHNIELYMKYSGYYKEKEKTNDKNRFKKNHMKRTEEGGFICPAGHEFELEKVTIDERSDYEKLNFLFRNKNCEGCPLRSRCTKSKSGRTINHNYQLEEYQKEVRENLESEEGKKLINKRSSETEGTFGDIKTNQGYGRLRRRGENGVKEEILLVGIGHNLRKYHRYKQKNKEYEEKKSIS